MELIIEKKDLKILLDKHKDSIGNYKFKEYVVSLFVYVITLFTVEFRDILFIKKEWAIFAYIVFICYLLYECVVSFRKMKKDNVTSDKLLDEIVELDKETHDHTILMIKDKFTKYPNRFLLYKELTWQGSMLFLNKRTIKDKQEHENEIIQYISDKLHIDKCYITIKYKREHIHTKYSKSAKKYKKYRHQFYEVNISNFPEQLQNDSFVIDDVEYKWMSLRDMWLDEDIVHDNGDIVNYVKEIYE